MRQSLACGMYTLQVNKNGGLSLGSLTDGPNCVGPRQRRRSLRRQKKAPETAERHRVCERSLTRGFWRP